MAKKGKSGPPITSAAPAAPKSGEPSVLLDVGVPYCGDNLEQFAKLADASEYRIYIDPSFNCNYKREGNHFRRPGTDENQPPRLRREERK
jgi:hypothetical protein